VILGWKREIQRKGQEMGDWARKRVGVGVQEGAEVGKGEKGGCEWLVVHFHCASLYVLNPGCGPETGPGLVHGRCRPSMISRSSCSTDLFLLCCFVLRV
jgi:hypothetical protein